MIRSFAQACLVTICLAACGDDLAERQCAQARECSGDCETDCGFDCGSFARQREDYRVCLADCTELCLEVCDQTERIVCAGQR